MRRVLAFTLLILMACVLGCRATGPASSGAPNLEQRVGQRVVLEGVVTDSKSPQVQGVDVWGLDAYRGRHVRVSGILRKAVVAEADIDPTTANRGAGTFYSLDEQTYELIQ